MRSLFAVIFGILCAFSWCHECKAGTHGIQSCQQVTSSHIGQGDAYGGAFRQNDYRLSLRIPSNLQGWGNTGDSPFHGFVIFLDPKEQSCLFLEMHIWAEENDPQARPIVARSVYLSHAKGWEINRSGRLHGRAYFNIATYFTNTHDGETDAGSLIFVTPGSDRDKTLPLFRQFRQSIRFGN